MTRTPELAPFRVFEACRQGLLLLGLHANAMVRMGLIPFAIVCVNSVLLNYFSAAPVTPLQNFIYGLPGIAAMGWMIFGCVRLWLLNETPQAPQTDMVTRTRLLQATVIAYVLWKALMAGYEHIFIALINPEELLKNPDALNQRAGAQVALMAMLGIMLWALRFRLAPVLTAVDYSLRDYANRARGFMISLRMLGLVLICVEFPKILLLSPLLGAGTPDVLLMLIGNAATFVLELWLFAAFAAALKEMMGARTRA